MTEEIKISYSYKEIEEKANAFLENINPKNKFPIDKSIWMNAEQIYNAQIHYLPLKNKAPDLLGSIVYDTRPADKNVLLDKFGKNAIIIINNDWEEKRQLFTVAHEFGHYFLSNKTIPHLGVEDRIDKTGNLEDNNKEYVVNVFAGCVLMPINKMLEYVSAKDLLSDEYLLSIDDINLLKNKFGVSENVVKARIKVIRENYTLA